MEQLQKFLQCHFCQKDFPVSNRQFIIRRSAKKTKGINHYCGKECCFQGRGVKSSVKTICFVCGKESIRWQSDIKDNKMSFCSHSCQCKHQNANKNGNQRSKLEKLIEENINKEYPDLEIHYNRRDAIQGELDIFIPSLKLAFELNGIFHYEPIFGEEKLSKTQSNDKRKFQACLERGIELCIIDSSKQKMFKPKTSQVYLDIIINVINQKMERLGGIEPLDIHPPI